MSRTERDQRMGDLVGSLNEACIGACNCMTKTPEIEHHKPLCRYRLFVEAAFAITDLRLALRDTAKERDIAIRTLLAIVPAADAMRDDIMFKDHRRVCDIYDGARKAFTRLGATDAAASATAPAGSAPAPVPDAESS